MRAELLDLLSALFPDKTWPKRVAAQQAADFTLETLPSSIKTRPDRGRPHAQQALHLTDVTNQRRR
jgi:hypothetical protein